LRDVLAYQVHDDVSAIERGGVEATCVQIPLEIHTAAGRSANAP